MTEDNRPMTEDNRPKMHRIKKDPQELDPRESPNPQRDNPTRWEKFKQEAAYAGKAAGTFVKDNWPLIAAFAGGMVVKTLLEDSETQKMPEINVPIVNNNTPVFNNTNTNTNANSMGGYSTKLVECEETGEIWKSAKDAAAAAGVSASTMSKHLNGRTDHVDGLHYTIIGLGSTGN